MKEKDIQICNLLRKRDAKGMKCLFDVYYRPLVVWSDTFLNDISLSEDLVQDFFIKLWESKSCEKLLASTLKSYLYISVRNLALNMKIKLIRYVMLVIWLIARNPGRNTMTLRKKLYEKLKERLINCLDGVEKL